MPEMPFRMPIPRPLRPEQFTGNTAQNTVEMVLAQFLNVLGIVGVITGLKTEHVGGSATVREMDSFNGQTMDLVWLDSKIK